MEKLKKLFIKYKEIILYLFFGVCTTAVSWISYYLFNNFVFSHIIENQELSITVSNAAAWVLAVAFAFITNKLFVFESKAKDITILKEIVTFVASRMISGVIEIFLPTGLIYMGLKIPLFGDIGLIPKLIVSVIVIILNYVLSKLLVFRKNK